MLTGVSGDIRHGYTGYDHLIDSADEDAVAVTREDWLLQAADKVLGTVLLPAAPSAGLQGLARPVFCISVGFPKGSHGRGQAVGQCWPPSQAVDKRAHIFVSPERDDRQRTAILGTVLHELIHATVGTEHGHKGAYRRLASACGLVKPFTTTTPSESLTARLNALGEELGAYPHGALLVPRKAKGSRLRLWECGCEPPVKVRVARDDFNAFCGDCGEQFQRV